MSIENATEEQLKKTLEQEGENDRLQHDAMMAEFNGENPKKEEKEEDVENSEDSGTEDTDTEEKSNSESNEIEKEEPEKAATESKNDDFEKLEDQKNEARIRKMESRVGNLYNKLESALKAVESQKGNASDKVEKVEEALKEFKELYPEGASEVKNYVEKQIAQVKGGLDEELEKKGYVRKDVMEKTLKEMRDDLTAEIKLDIKYPGWYKNDSTDIQHWLKTQDEGTKALADSDSLDDADTLLGLYYKDKAQKEEKQKQAEQEAKKVAQLKKSVPATKGSDKAGKRTMTEHEAMMEAFQH